ncbi:HAD superfamily (subfamily IIIA) phosphatase, TIGR01668 [Caldicellulosiruptor kronotskyensis 2002]|uniref:HAD superfamily (Subfamily IIIA) phosphatase, TIGR01668 n=1 Tax=Caldicellulosiruptor kronotskyensis (strain DSM 18902 / VKM B-2412 / 2002) TaxID=632348 RepID=E4SB52_CALK2|nr:YqeG family HAD IIIA-type phosphatase [Caldicellulosiruptor kronotskyensis]ADQ45707.1 HAD superfamily (subfamily IIIA) phosphatase, TIGR01668 [Caldicellulosiruptor kronotskyensis 2002]
MLKKFKPDMICKSILDIDLETLLKRGINYLIIDIDNTIVAWGEFEVRDEIIEWLEKAQKMGFKICLVSNNQKDRVKKIESMLGIPAIYNAKKPLKSGFLKASQLLHQGKKNNQTAVIGDQFFTDVIGAKRLKLFVILVRPMKEKEFFVTRINRIFEKKILKYYEKDERE